MRHFNGVSPQHPLIPEKKKYSWIEITYKHGAGQITEGPFLTRAQEALEKVGGIMADFIRDELNRPGPLGK